MSMGKLVATERRVSSIWAQNWRASTEGLDDAIEADLAIVVGVLVGLDNDNKVDEGAGCTDLRSHVAALGPDHVRKWSGWRSSRSRRVRRSTTIGSRLILTLFAINHIRVLILGS